MTKWYQYLIVVCPLLIASTTVQAQFEVKKQAAPERTERGIEKRTQAELDRINEVLTTGAISQSSRLDLLRARRDAMRQERITAQSGTARRTPSRRQQRLSATTTRKVGAIQIYTVNSAWDDADTSLDGVCDTGFDIDTSGTTECTLRAAIQEANLLPGSDSVIIQIDVKSLARGANLDGTHGHTGASDVWRITINDPGSIKYGALPPITRDNVHIDGTTQLDGSGVGTFPDAYCGNEFANGTTDSSIVKVMIDGSLLPDSTNIFNISGNDVSIQGLAVANSPFHGISAVNANRLNLNCLRVGTDHFGLVAEPNIQTGAIVVNGYGLRLTQSLLSGNGVAGASLLTDTAYVFDSFFGTDHSGAFALGNGSAGLALNGAAAYVGQCLASGNPDGILVGGNDNVVEATAAGTSRSLVSAIPNSASGVYITGNFNRIGGTIPASLSLISGNNGNGIDFSDQGVDNLIVNAWIGLDITGTTALPNGGAGVYDLGSSNQIGEVPIFAPPPVSESAAVLGADMLLAKNSLVPQHGTVISGNGSDGIAVEGTTTVVNTFAGTDVYGISAVGNGICGVYLADGNGHVVGGDLLGSANIISGNALCGLESASNEASIIGNYIGTNSPGTTAIANGGPGLLLGIDSDSALVRNNVISGNAIDGISVAGSLSSIYANFIGTDATGMSAVPNSGNGIRISGSAFGTVVGSIASDGNLISGNGGHGISSQDPFLGVYGNRIGTNIHGTAAIPNAGSGISSATGGGIAIGSSAAGGGNLISGNTLFGISIVDPTVTPPKENALTKAQGATYIIVNNLVGLDSSGTGPLPNGLSGISNDSPYDILIGSGNEAASANTVAFNGGNGIETTGSSAVTIHRNTIFANGGIGIDLGSDGVSPNDYGTPPDVDAGPNSLQNFPDLISAQNTGGNTVLVFDFFSTPSTSFRFHFFLSSTPDPTGYGEGEIWSGSFSGSTDANGYYPFNGVFPSLLPTGKWLSFMVVNNSTLETSEFSNAVQIDGESIVLSGAKVFLEGPYVGSGSMSTTLLAGGNIPVAQPYGDALFTGTPAEFGDSITLSSIPAGTVDWITISLRLSTNLASELARRVALLGSDGTIREFDGSTDVLVTGIADGSYHLVVCHRNHLCAMSASPVDFSTGTGSYDFTLAQGSAYSGGGSALKALSDGKFGLFAADNNADGQVTAPDFNQWNAETTAGATGYKRGDHNMDGIVTAPDFNQWNANTTAGAASQVPN